MGWSTAISDGALAIVSLGGGVLLIRLGGRSRTLGGIGLGIVGFAAALGACRHGVAPVLEPVHVAATQFASVVGVPLIGVGFLAASLRKQEWRHNLALAALVGLPGLAILLSWIPGYSLAIGALAMVVIAVTSGRRLSGKDQRNAGLAGLAGALLTMSAGLFMGTEGQLLGFDRIDWFHYALAAANLLLVLSLGSVASR